MSLNSNQLNLSSVYTNTVLVIKQQVRTKELKIRELEEQIDKLQLDIIIKRLQNLKRDQDVRISNMIQKITEYESQINILQEVKVKKSNRSPSIIYSYILELLIQPIQNSTTITKNLYPKEDNVQSLIESDQETIQVIKQLKQFYHNTNQQIEQINNMFIICVNKWRRSPVFIQGASLLFATFALILFAIVINAFYV